MSCKDCQEALYHKGAQRSYRSDASEAAFLLGGIGTGTISLNARGGLQDWEIFNRPAKGNKVPFSFFSIWLQPDGGPSVAKVLEARPHPPYTQAHGYHPGEVAGLPRFQAAELRGEYPFAWIEFRDPAVPVKVTLEAFTPFIPLNADDSGIPGIVFRYRIRNDGPAAVNATIAGSFANLVGFDGYDVFDNMKTTEGDRNEYITAGDCRGLFYSSTKLPPSHLKYGSMALLTANPNTTAKANWLDGGWWDGIQNFWDDFSRAGKVANGNDDYPASEGRIGPPRVSVGSLGIHERIGPGEEKTFEFILAWHFPNRVKSWDEDRHDPDGPTERNYYGKLFRDAWQAGKYLLDHLDRLEKGSRDFHRALFQSTLPSYVIDALASNITVIRSNTCFRIENGTFLAFEGCHNSKGSCEGTCTHVWNYAQTLAFLFPELERTARAVEFGLETDERGAMAFRTWQVFGKNKHNMLPAVDGQLGTIIRLYREWKFSGDDAFLRKYWDKAGKALDFAMEHWDCDGDGILDGQQHNTYDIEFYGPNPLAGSMFLAALKAAAEMAEYLGDRERAARYRAAFVQGGPNLDALLWNGEYYIQQLADPDQYRYQFGLGCLSDQLFGQTLAHLTGLGYILPKEHVQQAVKSIYQYNFRANFETQQSVQRTYVLYDESGLLLCSWPKGGRPKFPFVYSDEVWTGVEYQVASHLIYEGFVAEGLAIVKAVRDRYDGYRRNPWDEVECGHHYARTLASWGLLLALTGFSYDLVKGTIRFNPVINQEDFSTFWSTGKGWGIYTQKKDPVSGKVDWNIEVLYGSLEGVTVNAAE